MLRHLFATAALAVTALATPALAQTAAAPAPSPAPPQASEPLKARIAELIGILQGKGDYDGYFAPGFRAAVPKAKFDQVNAQLDATGGAVTGIEGIAPLSPWSATITVGYRNATASMRIAVAEAPPHQVEGLLVTGMAGREASLDAVAATIRALPGGSGFAFARLGEGKPALLVSHNVDRPFAIGSAFKLVILAELVRATNAGERKWTDTVTIDGRELPGGAYRLTPRGTQVSLRDLAAKMISVSDNSATDILLAHLGREKVEAMLPVVGIADPGGMRPFLSTMEMFKLKGIRTGNPAQQWLAKDEAGRRAMLPEIDAQPAMLVDPTLFQDGKPVLIDRIEWFASPADLVRVMDWLRRNSAAGPGAEARAILGINPGVPPAATGLWRSVGYKGGSEPGVMNMTLLLEGKDGNWYVLTGSWNDPAAAVDEMRFAGLIGRAAELAAPKP